MLVLTLRRILVHNNKNSPLGSPSGMRLYLRDLREQHLTEKDVWAYRSEVTHPRWHRQKARAQHSDRRPQRQAQTNRLSTAHLARDGVAASSRPWLPPRRSKEKGTDGVGWWIRAVARDGTAASKPGGSDLTQTSASTLRKEWAGRWSRREGSELPPRTASRSRGWEAGGLACLSGAGLVWGRGLCILHGSMSCYQPQRTDPWRTVLSKADSTPPRPIALGSSLGDPSLHPSQDPGHSLPRLNPKSNKPKGTSLPCSCLHERSSTYLDMCCAVQ